MFNIGMMELVLILLVAFLVVGPKDLPKVARWIARQLKKLRTLIREIKKETGWDDLSAEFRDAGSEIRSTMKDADISGELKNAAESIEKEVKSVQKEMDSAAADIKTAAGDLRADIEGGHQS